MTPQRRSGDGEFTPFFPRSIDTASWGIVDVVGSRTQKDSCGQKIFHSEPIAGGQNLGGKLVQGRSLLFRCSLGKLFQHRRSWMFVRDLHALMSWAHMRTGSKSASIASASGMRSISAKLRPAFVRCR